MQLKATVIEGGLTLEEIGGPWQLFVGPDGEGGVTLESMNLETEEVNETTAGSAVQLQEWLDVASFNGVGAKVFDLVSEGNFAAAAKLF